MGQVGWVWGTGVLLATNAFRVLFSPFSPPPWAWLSSPATHRRRGVMPDKVEEKVVAEEHAPASARGLVEIASARHCLNALLLIFAAVAAEAASGCVAAEAGATATDPEQQAVRR